MRNALSCELPDCFSCDELQVHCINFHSLTNGFLLLLSPPWASISAQLCCWQVEQPGGDRALCLPNKAVLCAFPLPTAVATVLLAPWTQNLRAISGPFVVDLAWENLRSWLLDTTAFLRGMKVIPWAWLLWSGGLAPCFWFTSTPRSHPWQPE